MYSMHHIGLGEDNTVLTMQSRYDPNRMKAREDYYFNAIVQDLANQYRANGFVDGVSYGDDGLGFLEFLFGGMKRPKIPWNDIYATARPLAHQWAMQEEQQRIQLNDYNYEVDKWKGIQASRGTGLITDAASIQKFQSNALVQDPVGTPRIKKL